MTTIPRITDRIQQPTPEEVRAWRLGAGLTQEQAAILVSPAQKKPYRTWQCYETPLDSDDHRDIPLAAWELCQLITGQHPTLQLSAKQ